MWHPGRHTTTEVPPRTYGPLNRFDPHPEGPPAEHPGTFVLYGSMAFDVSALEVFARTPNSVVEVCPSWRATLISAPEGTALVDLVDPAACRQVGATPPLGDTNLDHVGYAVTQGWARFLHASPGVHGVLYRSCRAADRSGLAAALFRKAAIGRATHQHRLVDDALWPYLLAALDAADIGLARTGPCPRCS